MLEQQLINAFMKFTAKAGAGDVVRNLIVSIEQNGNPKSWTPAEMQQAVTFLEQKVESFDRLDALNVIRSLMRKFDLRPAHIEAILAPNPKDDLEQSGVQGLQ